ncbi:MAG: hypothetical protein LBI82_01040 [Dysgonamonadaceae bacterium]|jgi:hypothetical protein|nr:hypothetical protein [Dysgonamonadaceae bacterium]
MKHKKIIILIISYFALLCILYIWDLPVLVLLTIGFITLLIVLIRQFYLLNVEHFRDKQRIFLVCLLFIGLMSTFLVPILDNRNPSRRVVMNVEYGEPKWQKTFFQLMGNGTFQYHMGDRRPINGQYESHGDTIVFKGGNNAEYPQFAILNVPAFQGSKFCGQITLYKNNKDSIGTTYEINKLFIRKSR